MEENNRVAAEISVCPTIRIAELEKENAELNQRLSEQDERINHLEKTNACLSQELDTLQKRLSVLEVEKNPLRAVSLRPKIC